MDIVVQYSYSIEPFFYSRRGEIVGIIKVYSMWIEGIESSIWRKFMNGSGCGIIGKFCKG